MLRRTSGESRDARSPGQAIDRLLEGLREGVKAIKDPAVEAKVREYFEQHPNYSRDLIHVAAVACQIRAAHKALEAGQPSKRVAAGVVKPISSPRPG